MFQGFVRSLHERNPFYLLSVTSMLAGCYAMSRGLGETPGQWKPLVSLMGVLQIYELALLSLAVLLLRRVRLERDARMAFLLGLLFLVDATYLNTELAAAHPWTALWVALAHLAFLVPKLFVVRDVVGLTSFRTLTLTVAQISILVYIPSTFSAVHFMDSHVHALGLGPERLPLVIYGIWWVVGLFPALFLWADRGSEHGEPRVARQVSRVSLLLPFASILLHLFSLHWMYNLRLSGAYLAPVLLAIGANLAYTFARDASGLRHALQWGAPLLALYLSSGSPETLHFLLFDAVVMSPTRMALCGIALAFWLHRSMSGRPSFTVGATLSLSLALTGHSFSTMRMTWMRLVPGSQLELGLMAIVGAFALLALALAVSLWRPQENGPATLSEKAPS